MLEEKVTPIIQMLPSREQLKERIVSLEQENERLQNVIKKMEVENNLLGSRLTRSLFTIHRLRKQAENSSSLGPVIMACLVLAGIFLFIFGLGIIDFAGSIDVDAPATLRR